MTAPRHLRFDARELPPYAEPIAPDDLREEEVFFFVTFADDDMLLPNLQPVVFIGRDLEPGDSGRAYFQDATSYLAGERYQAPSGAPGSIFSGSERELGHVFDYERALDCLLRCSLRRRGVEGAG